MMRLAYLPANIAWSFMFGDALCQLADNRMLFTCKGEAIEAAAHLGLGVDLKTNEVYIKEENRI